MSSSRFSDAGLPEWLGVLAVLSVVIVKSTPSSLSNIAGLLRRCAA
jgi:hypothetical protein